MTLFHRYEALNDAVDIHEVPGPDGPHVDDEMERLFYREARALAAELVSLRATTAEELAAQVLTDTANGEFDLCEGLVAAMQALVGRA